MDSPSNKSIRCLSAISLVLAAVMCSTGCESVTGVGHQTLVRVIDASTNAKAIDVNYGSIPIVVNQGANSFSNYAMLSPSAATVSVYPAGTQKATAQSSGNFLAAEQYSVFVTDSGTSYQASVIDDQNTAPSAGNFAVRFLQQASKAGAVDIYLVPDGSKLSGTKPLLSAVAAGTASAYINIPIGTYQVVIFPTGTPSLSFNPVVYSGTPAQFSNGQVRTMLIVDQLLVKNPAVNVVTGNDLN